MMTMSTTTTMSVVFHVVADDEDDDDDDDVVIGVGALFCGGGQNILMMALIMILPTDKEGYSIQFKLNEQTSNKRQKGITLGRFEFCCFFLLFCCFVFWQNIHIRLVSYL